MAKSIIYSFLLLLFCSFFVQAAIVECSPESCRWGDFSIALQNLLKTGVLISFWIAVLLSVIGAFLLMFHGPKQSLYERGKNLIYTAIIGYLLILAAGIIFDIILEFFGPIKLQQTTNIVFAALILDGGDSNPPTKGISPYYDFFKESLLSGLKCGQGATSAIDRLFKCIFEAIGLLKNLAVLLLTFAIIASAFVLITTPLFGFGNISKAWKILVWSIVGLVVILIADLIRAQIERLTK